MEPLFAVMNGLGSIPLLSDTQTRSISAENPTGAVGGGAKEDPDGKGAAGWLGKGWKVGPCITLPAGSTTTLAEIVGPGVIQHIWITVDPKAYRDTILRAARFNRWRMTSPQWRTGPSPSRTERFRRCRRARLGGAGGGGRSPGLRMERKFSG